MDSHISNLESLLGKEEPGATFHDSNLISLSIDYEKKTLVAGFELNVGDPDAKDEQARKRYRAVQLQVEGLQFWVMDPPSTPTKEHLACPWITDDGPLNECPTETAKSLAKTVTEKGFSWYFFFGDLNAFAYVAGTSVSFEWT